MSVTTGEMYVTHSDAVVGGLRFARTYNTARARTGSAGFERRYGVLGAGWNSNLEQRLVLVKAQVIELRLPDGTPVLYADPDDDSFFEQIVPQSAAARIESLGAAGYTRRFRTGGFESYDIGGKLLSVTDAAGVTTDYGYDALLRLERVERESRSLVLRYVGEDIRPVALESGDGTLLASYSYGVANTFPPLENLVAVDYPDGTGYRYAYNGSSQIVSIADAAGTPIEVHEYDNQGRAVTSEIAGGREKYSLTYGNNQTTVTDANGNVTVYEYAFVNHVKLVTKITGPCATCGGGGGGGGADYQEWVYTDEGWLKEYKDAPDNDPDDRRNVVWELVRDPETGDIREEIFRPADALPETTLTTYYPDGRVETRTGHDGSHVSYTYLPPGPREITEKIDATQSRTTTIEYTSEGQVKTITDPRGKTTTLDYDPTYGDLVTVWDPLSNPLDPLSNRTTFGYDDFGRRTTVTDPLGNKTTTDYDVRGRVTRITNHDDTYTEFGYDGSGRRSTVTDPMGRITRYTYDSYGRLKSVFDPLGGTTRYGYDLMSNLTSLTDAEGQTTQFQYENNRVERVTYPGGVFESFTYDERGLLWKRTDRKDVITTYSYDDFGRLRNKSYDDGTTPDVDYTYYPGGRLHTADNGSDYLTWSYDAAGQLKSEESDANGSVVGYMYDLAGNRESLSLDGVPFVDYEYDDASRLWKITRNGQVFEFEYDAASRRKTMTYPNGVVTEYAYDDRSRLTSLAATLDPGGSEESLITNFGYIYDDAGNSTSKTTLDHVEEYAYDPLYRLTGAARTGAGEQRWAYGYDAVGNRTRYQIGESGVMTSTYNERNQLEQREVGGRLRVRGTIDESGNVTVSGVPAMMLDDPDAEGQIFDTTIDAGDGMNPFTVVATDPDGTSEKTYQVMVDGTEAQYQYDPNGNLIQKIENGETWEYVWNAENQLIEVLRNSAVVAQYSYDPIGRRIARSASGATQTFTYAGVTILRESLSSGGSALYIHGRRIDEPLAREDESGVFTYYHADALKSVVKRTSDTGTVLNEYRYDPWGVREAGASDNGYAFTGREWSGDEELYYHRNRYYSPALGRFINEDPVGFQGGLHLYAYVLNDPINGTDPFGLWTTDAPRPGANTVVCDGRGGLDIQVPQLTRWNPQKRACLGTCTILHELTHLKQVEREQPRVCLGQAKSRTVVTTGRTQAEADANASASESAAYAVHIDCLQKKIGEEPCGTDCKNYLNAELKRIEGLKRDRGY